MHLERTPFYEKELLLRFAGSYGPGRYERAYEEWGIGYPPGQVRWTEGPTWGRCSTCWHRGGWRWPT